MSGVAVSVNDHAKPRSGGVRCLVAVVDSSIHDRARKAAAGRGSARTTELALDKQHERRSEAQPGTRPRLCALGRHGAKPSLAPAHGFARSVVKDCRRERPTNEEVHAWNP